MDAIHDTLEGRRPIQAARLKREARRLSDWTGLSLSDSQEITARAFGATSWQALLKDPTFVPDESLYEFGEDRKRRYMDLQQLLSDRLGICDAQGAFLAAHWQPTALRVNPLQLPRNELKFADDWQVLMVVTQPWLPAGVAAVVAKKKYQADRVLLAVPSTRLARFISADDVAPLLPSEAIAELLADWSHAYPVKLDRARIKALERLAAEKGAWSIDPAVLERLLDDHREPVKLKARWLKAPSATDTMQATFAEKFPWEIGDYPGLIKSNTRTFWRRQFGPIAIEGYIHDGTIYFDVQPQRVLPHSSVEAGIGGLRYLTVGEVSSGTYTALEDGFYLVKDSEQPRSSRPIAGMTDELAREVRQATGLADRRSSPQASHFYASEAGLALAKWVATFPVRAKNESSSDPYLFDWRSRVSRRMEFELMRAGALD